MQNTLYQNQQYTLKGVEDQINILTGILDQRQWKLRFPAALEKSYLDLRYLLSNPFESFDVRPFETLQDM